MTRQEKIEFIKSSRYFGFAYLNLEDTQETRLDEIIKSIVDLMQKDEVKVRGNDFKDFCLYLN
jgi:NADPH-dependent 7-cyano-7-deazaguanine reductase QueF